MLLILTHFVFWICQGWGHFHFTMEYSSVTISVGKPRSLHSRTLAIGRPRSNRSKPELQVQIIMNTMSTIWSRLPYLFQFAELVNQNGFGQIFTLWWRSTKVPWWHVCHLWGTQSCSCCSYFLPPKILSDWSSWDVDIWFPSRWFEILPSTCCIFEGFEEFKGESTLTSVITRLCGWQLFKVSPSIWRHEVRGVRNGNVWGCSNKVEAFYILKMSLMFFISVEMKNRVVDNFDQLLCCACFADGDCISHAYTTIWVLTCP